MATGGGDGEEGMDDYLSEIDDIHQSKADSGTTSQSDDELSKTPDEGEVEIEWLTKAGYGTFVSKHTAGAEILDEDVNIETTSLTSHQSKALKKRVDTLNATIRKKQKQQARGDVRDVFGVQNTGSGVDGDDHHKHHSEPTITYTTDIPANNPNLSASLSGAGAGAGSKRNARHVSTKARDNMSLLKTRGGYSMRAPTHHSADETGIAAIGFSVKVKEQNGEWDRSKVVMRQKPKKEEKDKEKVKPMQQGVTRMDDLSTKDRDKIRRLALIELTAMLDELNITYSRRKGKKKFKDDGWFGVPLQTLLERDRKKNRNIKVPALFTQLIQFLEKTGLDEEGILRVPGSVSRIKELRGELEEGFDNGTFRWEDVRPNDVAGLLKQFLRELPIPLLTLDYLEAFAQVKNIPEKEDQVKALNLLGLLLPDVHLETLLMLLSFLKKVVDCQKNKMNINNVAMIIAPNLFQVASKNKSVSPLDLQMAVGTAVIVRMLIDNRDVLNIVPPFLIEQIRHQYETEQSRKPRDKSIMKFLQKKDKSSAAPRQPTIANEADFQRRIAQIRVPGKESPMPVQLDSTMCVQQLLDQCYKQGESSQNGANKVYLYEVGGNIGERRLDPRANMESLFCRNPNAEWIVKC